MSGAQLTAAVLQHLKSCYSDRPQPWQESSLRTAAPRPAMVNLLESFRRYKQLQHVCRRSATTALGADPSEHLKTLSPGLILGPYAGQYHGSWHRSFLPFSGFCFFPFSKSTRKVASIIYNKWGESWAFSENMWKGKASFLYSET